LLDDPGGYHDVDDDDFRRSRIERKIGTPDDTPWEPTMTVEPAEIAVEQLDRGGSTLLYLHLATVLRGKIERGEWRPDQKIRSENELNRMYGISRMTALQGVGPAGQRGSAFRVQGKGTLVARRKIAALVPCGVWPRPRNRTRGDRGVGRLGGEVAGATLIEPHTAQAHQLSGWNAMHQEFGLRGDGQKALLSSTLPKMVTKTIWYVPAEAVLASRPAYGWSLDVKAFTAAVAHFAPHIEVVDLTTAPWPGGDAPPAAR